MPDSSAIDTALVGKLAGDATLAALFQTVSEPGAFVFMDEGPPSKQRFVIVSLVAEEDVRSFGVRSFEDALFLVEARMLSTSGGNIGAAAARIDVLLDHGTLTVAGFSLMALHREERTRITEVDAVDTSIRWYRRGGQYRLVMST